MRWCCACVIALQVLLSHSTLDAGAMNGGVVRVRDHVLWLVRPVIGNGDTFDLQGKPGVRHQGFGK